MSIPARLFTRLLFFCALTALPVQAESVTTLYDVDFSSPLHTVGQPPTVGPFEPVCRTVYGYEMASVTDCFGEMDQPCVLYSNPSSWSSSIKLKMYDYDDVVPYSRIRIEADLLIDSLEGGSFDVDFTEELEFYANGIVTNDTSEAQFSFGRPMHLEIEIDLLSNQYKATVDEHLFTGALHYRFEDLYFFLYGDGESRAAIDNIKIYGIGNKPELVVTCPQAGKGFTVGKTYPITWYSSSDVQNVYIEYSTDAGATWSPMAPQNAGNTGVYDWTIPNTPSNFCKLRLTDSTAGAQAESGLFRLCEPVAPLPAYEVIYLNDVFGVPVFSKLSATNDNNTLVLFVNSADGYYYVWLNGEAISFKDSIVVDVNCDNQILLTDGFGCSRTFQIWQNGGITQTVTLEGCADPIGINDLGSVLLELGSGGFSLWRNGGFTGLSTDTPARFRVEAFNNNDQVVGTYYKSGIHQFFIWSDNEIQMFDLPSVPWYASATVMINNNGTVAGSLNERAFAWKDSQWIELGPGELLAFNDYEQYVTALPWIEMPGEYPNSYFWPVYLNHGGEQVNLQEAAGLPAIYYLFEVEMNNKGWITAILENPDDGSEQAVLLVPQKDRTLESLTIIGPETLFAGSIVPLHAVGACDDNCPVGLTELVTWNVYPAQAGFVDAEGLFHAGDLVGVEEIVVTAEYTAEKTLRTFRSFEPHASRQLFVPSEYPTIQAAIDAAAESDEIILKDGVYRGEGNRNVEVPNKRIVIRSQNGPQNCIIDPEYSTGFICSGHDLWPKIKGITITNADYAVKLNRNRVSARADFENCVLTRNNIGVQGIEGTFTNCTIAENNCGFWVSVVHLDRCILSGTENGLADCTGTVVNSRISGRRDYPYCELFSYCDMDVYNCVISSASTGFYGHAGSVVNCVIAGNQYGATGCPEARFVNCIFYKNREAAIGLYNTDAPVVSCCDFFENMYEVFCWDDTADSFVFLSGADAVNALEGAEGNISADPLFEVPGRTMGFEWAGTGAWIEGDYRLRHGSPCIDAGADVSDRPHTVDPDGTLISQDGDLDGAARTDIGIYEYVQHVQPYIDIRENEVTLVGEQGMESSRSVTLSLRNKGLNPLAWTCQADVSWLTPDSTSGIIEGVSCSDIVLSANIESLTAGTYTGHLAFCGENTLNTEELTIRLIVARYLRVPSEYPTIQAAVDAAQDYDTVLLADGIYTGDGNRDISFGGKKITVTSQSRPAYCVIDCQGSETDPHRAFVFENGETSASVLSGVSIINGCAPDFEYLDESGLAFSSYCGGGVLIYNASPSITDCIFENCTGSQGGAIYCLSGNPVILNTIFRKNAGGGAAIHHSSGSIVLSECAFSSNTSVGFMSISTISDSASVSNSFSLTGPGGVYLASGTADIRNSSFSGNTGDQSGAITAFNMETVFTNCTFTGNKGGSYASVSALAYDIPEPIAAGMIEIYNCIFNDNAVAGSPEVIDGKGLCFWPDDSYMPMMQVNYSAFDTLSPDLPGVGNIQADPLFAREGYWDDGGTPGDGADDVWVEGDYHLRSEGWAWDVLGGQWAWDEVTSPCIDAGNPAQALGDEPLTLGVDPLNRFGQNVRVNMGAYGGTAEASMAPEGWAMLSDLDNSGRVTLNDFALLAELWLTALDALPADTTRDGVVDSADLMLMADQWLRTALWLED